MISRRNFLKLAALSAGALAFRPFAGLALPEFPQAEKLIIEFHQGNLYYRCRGSAGRISYRQIRQGLEKKEIRLQEEPLPF